MPRKARWMMIKLTIECRDVEHARACIDALNAHAPDVEKQTAAIDALVEAVENVVCDSRYLGHLLINNLKTKLAAYQAGK